MSKAHDQIPAPYKVTLDGGEPVSVDPNVLKDLGIRLDRIRDSQYVLHMEGKTIPIVIEALDRKNIRLSSQNRVFEAVVRDHRDQLLAEWGLDVSSQQGAPEILAPMPGLVLSLKVAEGQAVSAGDPLLVLEAMKMENEIKAPFDAVVKSVHVSAGDAVQKGQLLIGFGYESK